MKPQPENSVEGSHKVAIYRREKQLSQAELAQHCGLSRQFVNMVEAGKTQPNVQVALRLAEALACSVEDLFGSDKPADDTTLTVKLEDQCLPEGARLRIARVSGRWVGHAADTMQSFGGGFADADAILTRVGTKISARTHRTTTDLEQNIAIAGCDPAMALLQGDITGVAGRCFWVNCGSARALELLASGSVHAAGLHYAGTDDKENLRHIERLDAAGRWQVLRFTRWEQGWMLRPGLQKKFHDAADLNSREIRLANREPGSGSRHWLDAKIAEIGVSDKRIRGYGHEYKSHWECARTLNEGQADVAVGPRAVAAVFGLEFLPVMEVAFDLVIPRTLIDHPRIQAILQRMRSRGFRREIEMLPGYQAPEAGMLLERASV